ncbi:helix-turn-helix domain-containing protein [Arthrobacter sp. B0490]|uniref:helix-turn-helix domain-containing protein n=1 Tax=Arthrobacter sp. B0490 TaxID=2058891 RepID=UPI0015E2CCB8|nr:helix-turn-helix transcriptional regulator [Arthrobacter sp. B0490]
MRFGDMLRQARSAKGLTQAELGAGVYSDHFISLLERGLRQPTPDMVQHFATQLGMAVQTLNWWVERPSAEDQPALTTAMFAANYARDMHDDALAASEAEYAADIAFEQRNGPAWWDMSMLHAQSLIALRRLDEAEAVLLQMEKPSLMVASAELRSVVQGRLSTIARASGRLLDALELARRSAESAAELPEQSPARLQAAFILIAALSVKGDLDEAWDVATGLDVVEGAPFVPSLLIARGAWAIGNVAFRRGEVEVGQEQHALAARLLLPQSDLVTWAEFHRASASLKMQAGIVDESVRESLGKAELGLRLVGSPSHRSELTLVQARFALLSEDLGEAKELLDAVDGQRTLLDFESITELEDCLGQYHAAAGAPSLAARHLAEAARLYSDAGAEEKARELTEQIRALKGRGVR